MKPFNLKPIITVALVLLALSFFAKPVNAQSDSENITLPAGAPLFYLNDSGDMLPVLVNGSPYVTEAEMDVTVYPFGSTLYYYFDSVDAAGGSQRYYVSNGIIADAITKRDAPANNGDQELNNDPVTDPGAGIKSVDLSTLMAVPWTSWAMLLFVILATPWNIFSSALDNWKNARGPGVRMMGWVIVANVCFFVAWKLYRPISDFLTSATFPTWLSYIYATIVILTYLIVTVVLFVRLWKMSQNSTTMNTEIEALGGAQMEAAIRSGECDEESVQSLNETTPFTSLSATRLAAQAVDSYRIDGKRVFYIYKDSAGDYAIHPVKGAVGMYDFEGYWAKDVPADHSLVNALVWFTYVALEYTFFGLGGLTSIDVLDVVLLPLLPWTFLEAYKDTNDPTYFWFRHVALSVLLWVLNPLSAMFPIYSDFFWSTFAQSRGRENTHLSKGGWDWSFFKIVLFTAVAQIVPWMILGAENYTNLFYWIWKWLTATGNLGSLIKSILDGLSNILAG